MTTPTDPPAPASPSPGAAGGAVPEASSTATSSLAATLAPNTPVYPTVMKGVVTAVNLNATPPSFDAQVNGDTTTTVPGIAMLDSWTPVVGDTVTILKQGSDVFAVGQLNNASNGGSANGWQAPGSLGSGFTTGTGADALMYRLVVDNGDQKIQWKGGVAVSGTPSAPVCTLSAGFRPAADRNLLLARDPTGGANVALADFKSNGDVVVWGLATAPASTTPGAGGAPSSNTTTDPGGLTTGAPSNNTTNVSGGHYTDSVDTSTGGAAGDGHWHAIGVNNYSGSFNNHTHGMQNHTHTTGGHTHGMQNHTHTGAAHVHAVTAPTWVSFNGVEYYL